MASMRSASRLPTMAARLRSVLAEVRGEVKRDEPLAPLTSFQIGGKADALVAPADLDDLCRLVAAATHAKIPMFVMGGTNLLVRDRGIRGMVMQLTRFQRIRKASGDRLYAQAGVRLPRLLAYAARSGLEGLEWAAGIPGTVGGGIVNNAGTKLGEMQDVLQSIEYVTPRGNVRCMEAERLSFRYRSARVPKGVIVGAWFQLREADSEPVASRTKAYLKYRKQTQPLTWPNAGSIFKNPAEGTAGSFIQAAGLKGAQVGNAQVSPIHANFIVNLGGARAADVERLIRRVRRTVARKTGVKLQREVKIVGEA